MRKSQKIRQTGRDRDRNRHRQADRQRQFNKCSSNSNDRDPVPPCTVYIVYMRQTHVATDGLEIGKRSRSNELRSRIGEDNMKR